MIDKEGGPTFRKPARAEPVKWERWHIVTLILVALFAAVLTIIASAPDSSPTAALAPARQVASARPCPDEMPERDALLSRDTVLRADPAAGASPITKPAITAKPGDIEALATATPATPIRAVCTTGGWARVRVLATGLRWMEGWVPAATLKDISLDAQGRRTLTDADIEWQPGVGRDKAAIVKVANRIVREDGRCEAIDERSLLVEGDGADRRYTLVCDGPGGAIPITFAARDANGKSFRVAATQGDAEAAGPIDKADAASACIDEITKGLHQPRSADFHTFSDTTFNVEGSRARVTVGFEAKNGLGLEIESTAACIFEGAKLVSAEVLPAGS